MVTSDIPGVTTARITVTQLGGTIWIGGLKFAEHYESLPPLKSGTEGLFLLKQVGANHRIVGSYFGAFRITQGVLIPMINNESFAPEYRNVPIGEATARMLASVATFARP
jgi:hypothetical protein